VAARRPPPTDLDQDTPTVRSSFPAAATALGGGTGLPTFHLRLPRAAHATEPYEQQVEGPEMQLRQHDCVTEEASIKVLPLPLAKHDPAAAR
jgi:hypothetical protein